MFRKDRIVDVSGGVDSLVLVSWQRDRVQSRSSSVVVRDFCSLPLWAHRCRTVSSSAHWKLLCHRFLHSYNTPVASFSEVFCKWSDSLFWITESGVRENGKLFVERQRTKESLNGGSQIDFTDELLKTDGVTSFFLADVHILFSSSFDISSIGFENLVPLGLVSHSITLRWKLLLLRNLHECVKFPCSCLKFCNFGKNLNVYVPLNILIPNFMAFSFLLVRRCL